MLLAALWMLTVSAGVTTAACPPDQLALYRLTLQTEWSEERFPKQYPKWRPHAQWSRVVGRSHNDTYHLWKLGELVSDAVKQFVETAKSDLLGREGQGGVDAVFDEFYAPPIHQGVGRTEGTLFVDGNHSKVSLMCRIVPSPDWFVGVDSFDLCVGDKFVDAVTLDLDPLDAGTDNGFTFTSPNWDTVPRARVSRITAQHPNHLANSFFYPQLKTLPRLAYLRLVKLREYSLTQVFLQAGTGHNRVLSVESTAQDYTEFRPSQVERIKTEEAVARTTARGHPKLETSDDNDVEDKNDVRKLRRRMQRQMKARGPRPCRVGEWAGWSSCSKTCGLGESIRSRKVLKHAARGGKPCPPLQERKWCGSARNCRNSTSSYFAW